MVLKNLLTIYFRDKLVGNVNNKERKWHATPYEECPGGFQGKGCPPTQTSSQCLRTIVSS